MVCVLGRGKGGRGECVCVCVCVCVEGGHHNYACAQAESPRFQALHIRHLQYKNWTKFLTAKLWMSEGLGTMYVHGTYNSVMCSYSLEIS